MTTSIGVNLRVTGHCSQGGRKYMEDFFSVAYQQSEDNKGLEYAFFGIYDGHGGSEAAAFAKESLMYSIVTQTLFWSDDENDILAAIREGFSKTHNAMWREIEKWPKTSAGLPSTAGTTASIAFIRHGKIYIGHVGDSGIVLGYQEDGYKHWRAEALTQEHKPECNVEKARIMSSGGKVVSKSGVPRVVWNRPRIGHKGPVLRSTQIDEIPFLAVARSLGDLWSYNYSSNEFVVSPDPDVRVIKIDTHKFRCLIFGTDGLWNVLTPSAAVEAVRNAEKFNYRNGYTGAPSDWINPSKSLVDKALEQWSTTKTRADNTSAVTIMLDPPGPPKNEVLKSNLHNTYGPCMKDSDNLESSFEQNMLGLSINPPTNGVAAIMTRFNSDTEASCCDTEKSMGYSEMVNNENGSSGGGNGDGDGDSNGASTSAVATSSHSSFAPTDFDYMNSFAESYNSLLLDSTYSNDLPSFSGLHQRRDQDQTHHPHHSHPHHHHNHNHSHTLPHPHPHNNHHHHSHAHPSMYQHPNYLQDQSHHSLPDLEEEDPSNAYSMHLYTSIEEPYMLTKLETRTEQLNAATVLPTEYGGECSTMTSYGDYSLHAGYLQVEPEFYNNTIPDPYAVEEVDEHTAYTIDDSFSAHPANAIETNDHESSSYYETRTDNDESVCLNSLETSIQINEIIVSTGNEQSAIVAGGGDESAEEIVVKSGFEASANEASTMPSPSSTKEIESDTPAIGAIATVVRRSISLSLSSTRVTRSANRAIESKMQIIKKAKSSRVTAPTRYSRAKKVAILAQSRCCSQKENANNHRLYKQHNLRTRLVVDAKSSYNVLDCRKRQTDHLKNNNNNNNNTTNSLAKKNVMGTKRSETVKAANINNNNNNNNNNKNHNNNNNNNNNNSNNNKNPISNTTGRATTKRLKFSVQIMSNLIGRSQRSTATYKSSNGNSAGSGQRKPSTLAPPTASLPSAKATRQPPPPPVSQSRRKSSSTSPQPLPTKTLNCMPHSRMSKRLPTASHHPQRQFDKTVSRKR